MLGRYRVWRIRQPPQIISKFQSYSFNNLASSQPYINMFQGKTCKRLVANWGQTTMHLLNSKMDRPTIYPIHCICPCTCNTSHIYTRQTRTHDKIQWSSINILIVGDCVPTHTFVSWMKCNEILQIFANHILSSSLCYVCCCVTWNTYQNEGNCGSAKQCCHCHLIFFALDCCLPCWYEVWNTMFAVGWVYFGTILAPNLPTCRFLFCCDLGRYTLSETTEPVGKPICRM